MGSAYSSLIYGVPEKSLLKVEIVKSVVTKYDENTGAPYPKEVVRKRLMLCDQEVDIESYDEYDDGFWTSRGLDAVSQGGEYGDPENIIGVSIGDGSADGSDPTSINPGQIEEAKLRVKNALDQLGYIGTPQLYLCTCYRY